MVKTISKPVSVKVRLVPGEPQDSINLYDKLINDCGIHLLTIHGRTRHQKGRDTGHADWDMIKLVVEKFGHQIPIFANGSIANLQDVQRCLDHTGVDGIMSSEAILEYPPIFYMPQKRIGRIQLAKEYLQLAQQYPPDEGGQGSGLKSIRVHIHRFLHEDLELKQNNNWRQDVATAPSIQYLFDIIKEIEQYHKQQNHQIDKEQLVWYMRYRTLVPDPNGQLIKAYELRKRKDHGLLHARVEDDDGNDDNVEDGVLCDLFGDDDGGDY